MPDVEAAVLHVVENDAAEVHVCARDAEHRDGPRREQAADLVDRPRGGALRGGAEPAAAVKRHHVLLAEGEGIDLQLRDVGALGAAVDAEMPRDRDEGPEAAKQLAVRHAAAMPAGASGEKVVGRGLLEEFQELGRRGVGGTGFGDGDAGPHLGGEILGVDAAEAGRDDRTELARGADADEELVTEAGAGTVDVFDDQDARDPCRAVVLSHEAFHLAADRLIVLRNENDPVRLGLVDDVLRGDLQHHLLAGKQLERFLGDHAVLGDEEVPRRGDGADQLDEHVHFVLVQGPPLLLVGAQQRALERGGLGAGQAVLHQVEVVEAGGRRRLGAGQLLEREDVDPASHGARRAAALHAVAIGGGSVAAEAESAAIDRDDLLTLGGEHLGHRILELAGVKLQEQRAGAERHDVGRERGAGGLRQPVGVDQHVPRELGHAVEHLLDGRIVVDVHEGVRADHHDAVFPQVLHVAQGLQRLDREHDVGLPGRDEVAEQLVVGDPQVRLHRAAALRHAVHFGLLDVEIASDGGDGDGAGDGQDALPAHAGENEVLFHGQTLPGPVVRPALCQAWGGEAPAVIVRRLRPPTSSPAPRPWPYGGCECTRAGPRPRTVHDAEWPA